MNVGFALKIACKKKYLMGFRCTVFTYSWSPARMPTMEICNKHIPHCSIPVLDLERSLLD